MRTIASHRIWGTRLMLVVYTLTLVSTFAVLFAPAQRASAAPVDQHAIWIDKTHILMYDGRVFTETDIKGNAGTQIAFFSSPGACNIGDQLIVPHSTPIDQVHDYKAATTAGLTLITWNADHSGCVANSAVKSITLDNTYNDVVNTTPPVAKWVDATHISFNGDTFQAGNPNNHEITLTDTKVTNCTLGNTVHTADTLKVGDNGTNTDYQVATSAVLTTFEQTSGSTPCQGVTKYVLVNPTLSSVFAYTGTWADGTTINVDTSGKYIQTKTDGNKMTLQHTGILYDCLETTKNGQTSHFNEVNLDPYPTARTGTITIWHSVSPANGVTVCTSQTLQIRITNTNPDQCTGTSCTTTTNPDATSTDSCLANQEDKLRWIECPVYDAGYGILTPLHDLIGSFLVIPVSTFFSANFLNAFSKFRDIGVALLVIAGLVMVISQAADLEILSAHTVRKALPRIIVAAVGISLSWPLLKFTVVFFNDLGDWVGQIILLVTDPHGGAGAANVVGRIIGGIGGSVIAIIATATAIGTLTFGGIMALIFSAIILLVLAMLVLAFRWLVVLMCILLAPLAIAAYILPGTEKLWNFWKDTFITTLMMYPVIMAFLAAGAAMSNLASSTDNFLLGVLAFFLYFAPYFMIPFAFKLAGGLMGRIIDVAQGQHRKSIEDRLAGYRANERKWRQQRIVEGRENVRGLGRIGQEWMRRTSTPGGFSGNNNPLTRRGRANWQAQLRKQRTTVAQSIIEKEDLGMAAVDDMGNEIAVRRGVNRNNFLQRHIAAQRRSGAIRQESDRLVRELGLSRAQADVQANTWAQDNAMRSRSMIETSYGAEIGTETSRLTAMNALMRSSTSYRGNDYGATNSVRDGLQRTYNDAADLVSDNIITAEQAASLMKFAPGAAQRIERSKDSFGSTMSQITSIANGNAITNNDLDRHFTGALSNVDAGTLLQGRDETLAAYAPIMANRIAGAHAAAKTAIGNAAANPTNVAAQRAAEAAKRQLADYAAQADSLYNYLKSTSEAKANILADGVYGQVVTSAGTAVSGPAQAGAPGLSADDKTIRSIIESMRGESGGGVVSGEYDQQYFRDRSREYGSALAANQAQGGQQQQQQGGSDRRIKKDIVYLETLENGIHLYRFRYLWGGPVYVGVIAQDLLYTHPEAVLMSPEGYYRVDYAKLGMRMMTFDAWKRANGSYMPSPRHAHTAKNNAA